MQPPPVPSMCIHQHVLARTFASCQRYNDADGYAIIDFELATLTNADLSGSELTAENILGLTPISPSPSPSPSPLIS